SWLGSSTTGGSTSAGCTVQQNWPVGGYNLIAGGPSMAITTRSSSTDLAPLFSTTSSSSIVSSSVSTSSAGSADFTTLVGFDSSPLTSLSGSSTDLAPFFSTSSVFSNLSDSTDFSANLGPYFLTIPENFLPAALAAALVAASTSASFFSPMLANFFWLYDFSASDPLSIAISVATSNVSFIAEPKWLITSLIALGFLAFSSSGAAALSSPVSFFKKAENKPTMNKLIILAFVIAVAYVRAVITADEVEGQMKGMGDSLSKRFSSFSKNMPHMDRPNGPHMPHMPHMPNMPDMNDNMNMPDIARMLDELRSGISHIREMLQNTVNRIHNLEQQGGSQM
ncbi:hypothetical protein GZH46_01530, partial [Fragariocoptes setiger]